MWPILIQLALSVGLSLLSEALKPKPKAVGIRGSETSGGDAPLSFIIGRWGTAGHREYSGTWGSDGGTPNAYYTLVRSVSDIPVRGLAGLFVNGEAVTLGGVHHANGYPVLEYRKSGVDYLWVEFFDGTQTTADTFMVSKFGSDPDRPWQSDMIGRGIAWARITARYNRDLFNGLPDPFFVVDGFECDDPRGDDAQDNPIVQIHQIMSGIYYDGDWVWGLQDLPTSRLPSTNWEAQMDKCDVDTAKADASTEPRFRTGMEITVDMQPADVIEELLEACNGRIAEIGGIYKVLVAEPDEPVVSFTDEDIAISQGQTFDPFPGLENTTNGIDGSYIEPIEKWTRKDAPALRDSTFENADDSRRLPASVQFATVYSGTQAQRLMSAMLKEDRRFRTHAMTMPPEWWEYEVLDTVSWTSEYNGYTDKVFMLTVMDDMDNGFQFIALKEQDGADYDWDAETDEQAAEVVPLVIQRPPPQPMTGWSVAPYIYVDNVGADRKPGIEIGFAGELDDVRAVRIQVRLEGETGLVFDGEVPYDIEETSPTRALYGNFIIPNTDYEVRGKFLPFSGRETEWSDWLLVTTPNVSETIGAAEIAAAIKDQLNQLGQIRNLIERVKQIGSTFEEADLANFSARQSLTREISVKLGVLEASFNEIIEVALGPGGAIAVALESLYAALGGNNSQVNVKFEAVAGVAGYSAAYAVQARTEVDGIFRTASFIIQVPDDPGDPTRIVLSAGQTVFATSAGDPIGIIGDDGVLRSANDVVQIALVGVNSGAVSITVT